MRRVRSFAIVAAVVITLCIVFTTLSSRSPVSASALGRRSSKDDVGYLFAVTNHASQSLDVMLRRDNAPKEGMVGAFTSQRVVQPGASWTAALYPPPEGVPWSATILYLRRPGRMETHLRRAGAWLGLCKRDPQWEVAVTIDIKQ
jgi:hypothetical protein